MTSEEVTYADLKFMTLEKFQDQELQTAAAKDSSSPSSCWRLATMVLGVFCLSSVAAAGVLAAKCKDENFTLQKAVMESLNQQLELLQAQNLNLTETVKQLATHRGHKCIPCPENWLQYGENCYFFSEEWKTWQESKAKCSALESRLIKIESKEKLDFIMQSALSRSSSIFWIGLSHNRAEGPWLWEDGSAFSPDLFQIQ
ncbi:oxidized low-density lipoprotein receptor 1 [Melopsittacus undulatus]|uniref:oxidized low-density lipoprotein receptor 1 n=1 Tax=Melopsittacus undulatus TaxID=13146 RepID=UPI00124368DD|nr:oxidized low-density lipoprotein receptor 1 [Melopsittacus undulatus]